MTGKISDDAAADPTFAVADDTHFAAEAGLVNKGPSGLAIATYVFAKIGTLTSKTINAASNTITNLTTAMFAANVVDTDGTLAANSDTRIASQKAVKTYADQLIAAADAMVFKGVIDCSGNPNYPAADRGWTYKASVAGKIGGASGLNVEVSDTLICITDGTASGNQATVGGSWTVIQANIDGAVTGPASSTSGNFATFNGATGKILQDSGVAISTLGLSPGGRLTLQSGVPIMSSTQSGKATLYYTPAVHAMVPIYDGTTMKPTSFAELSIATTDTTKNPAAIGASKVNDWFVWNDGGTLRLSHGPDWTSDTARSAGTALVMVNGILLNNASITNGPAAQRGTYVGTTRSDGSNQLNWVLGAAGTAGNLAVWNMYNRKQFGTTSSENSASWSYSSATVRASNGGSAARVSFVSGLAEENIPCLVTQGLNIAAGGGSFAQFGMKLDATNGFDKYADPGGITGSVAQLQGLTIQNVYASQLGYHFISLCEAGDGTTSTTFTGISKHGITPLLTM